MLTTKEFMKKVKELGFVVREIDNYISIYDNDGILIAETYAFDRFIINTSRPHFILLPEDLKEALFNLLSEYTSTPTEDKKEPERFYFEFKGARMIPSKYLSYNKHYDYITVDTVCETDVTQTRFTQKEIDEIKEKFGLTLSDFEQLIAEDDEE